MAEAEKPKRAKKAAESAPVATIQSVKGFDQNLVCRGHTFEIGKTYEMDGTVKACSRGWHACTLDAHPFEVFGYYAPAGSRFCLVTQGGETHSDDNIKIASAKITIDCEISIGDLVKRAWDYVWSRAVKSDDAHITITQGAASSTGDRGAAMASGYAGKVMGGDGNALFAVERDDNYAILSVAAGIVGRDGIEPNIWYVARGGKLVLT